MTAPWRGARPGRAAVAGLCGAAANSLAIHATRAFGIRAGTGGLAAFVFAGLRAAGLHAGGKPGPVGQELFHAGVGVLAALAYALFADAVLPGPRLVRALVFVQALFLAQGLVILPWLGAGMFGLRNGAWTPLWSFALNALFGVVLGLLYRPAPR